MYVNEQLYLFFLNTVDHFQYLGTHIIHHVHIYEASYIYMCVATYLLYYMNSNLILYTTLYTITCRQLSRQQKDTAD